ncbi:hypothetical protein SOVF_046380 [Spinacia oleracea]|nr:hypothetical protein SOVF_046380 [Spinacia oleracea]
MKKWVVLVAIVLVMGSNGLAEGEFSDDYQQLPISNILLQGARAAAAAAGEGGGGGGVVDDNNLKCAVQGQRCNPNNPNQCCYGNRCMFVGHTVSVYACVWCPTPGFPCGRLDPCCPGFTCTAFFSGSCVRN